MGDRLVATRLPFLDDLAIARQLSPADALSVIGAAFSKQIAAPPRLSATSDEGGGAMRTLLAMPAIRPRGVATVKVVTALQGSRSGLSSHLLAFDCNGALIAVVEAHRLTALRTAAASVLAAKTLGAGNARHLAVIGAGRQAQAQLEAFAAAMPIQTVTVWARRREAAEELVRSAGLLDRSVAVASSVAEAVEGADLVTSATASETPLIQGDWIMRGAHVDLVGGFRPIMREADDALIARATIVTDTAAALAEAGDLCQPIANGLISASEAHLLGDLLAGKAMAPRGDITLFKSVRHAAEDLVVTELLLARLGMAPTLPDADREQSAPQQREEAS